MCLCTALDHMGPNSVNLPCVRVCACVAANHELAVTAFTVIYKIWKEREKSEVELPWDKKEYTKQNTFNYEIHLCVKLRYLEIHV